MHPRSFVCVCLTERAFYILPRRWIFPMVLREMYALGCGPVFSAWYLLQYTLVVPGKGRVTVKVARVAGDTVTFEYAFLVLLQTYLMTCLLQRSYKISHRQNQRADSEGLRCTQSPAIHYSPGPESVSQHYAINSITEPVSVSTQIMDERTLPAAAQKIFAEVFSYFVDSFSAFCCKTYWWFLTLAVGVSDQPLAEFSWMSISVQPQCALMKIASIISHPVPQGINPGHL